MIWTNLVELHPRVIPVKFDQNPPIGLGGDVVLRNCWRRDKRTDTQQTTWGHKSSPCHYVTDELKRVPTDQLKQPTDQLKQTWFCKLSCYRIIYTVSKFTWSICSKHWIYITGRICFWFWVRYRIIFIRNICWILILLIIINKIMTPGSRWPPAWGLLVLYRII
jgi:hypothetical protein